MDSGYSQQGFVLSLGLHTSVIAVVAVLAWVKPFERKTEQVFELIPLGTSGAATADQQSDLSFDLPAPAPPPPPPRPQPQQQRPPPPRVVTPPAPRQAPPPPRVQPAPPVRPVPAPPVQAVPPPPEKVTWQDFVQQHGQPKQRAPRAPAPAKARPAPRIDTRFTPNISAIGTTPGRADGDPNAGEIAAYLFRLAEAVKEVWIVSLDLEVHVDVDIAPSGQIKIVRVSKASGNAAFDESALEALRTIGSIGPTPRGLRIVRTLRFRPE